MVANGGEGDVDCGGPCAPCLLGQHCNVTADCAAGACVGGTCESVLYVSEVRSHGKNGNGHADELVELYNPGSLPVTLDATWVLMIRNANGGCQDMGYGIPLYVGAGQVIPPHGHTLFTGSGYAQSPASDGTLLNSGGYGGVHDAGAITLLHQGKLVDTVCYYTSQATLDALQVCASPYACAGTPIDNAQALGGVDVSFSRKPGGVLGNGQMTGDNAADFAVVMPANPQNLASPPRAGARHRPSPPRTPERRGDEPRYGEGRTRPVTTPSIGVEGGL